jgi:two-component system cell cycle response regulator
MIEERAPELARHMLSVQGLACSIAAELGVHGDEYEALAHAALLHDIGKIAIPENILEKPAPLSDAEWEMIRRHTLIGERILAAAPALQRSARLVRWSHERMDGAGYPDGLRGGDIPLPAQIVFVADAFDAMTEARAYRQPRGVDEALAELRACSPAQFDPDVVAALTRVLTRAEAA